MTQATESVQVAFTMRLPAELRAEFDAAAKANDRSAAQLVRDFMRDYIRRHAAATAKDAK